MANHVAPLHAKESMPGVLDSNALLALPQVRLSHNLTSAVPRAPIVLSC